MLEFILATVGLTFIITYSYLFENFRKYIKKRSSFLGNLIMCTQCTGTWIGIIIKFLLMIYYDDIINWYSLIILILYGFIGSIVSFTWYSILKKYTNI